MKKILAIAALIASTVGVFAQGTITFNNRVTSAGVDFKISLNDINGNFVSNLSGSGYTAQIWSGTSAGSLVAASPTTDFRTGAAAGYVNPVTATLPGIPKDAASAFIQVRAWDNQGGTITTWAQAVAANVATGFSNIASISAIGGDFNAPPNLVGINAFAIQPVPEPSTIALGILGAGSLLLIRRKK